MRGLPFARNGSTLWLPALAEKADSGKTRPVFSYHCRVIVAVRAFTVCSGPGWILIFHSPHPFKKDRTCLTLFHSDTSCSSHRTLLVAVTSSD